MSKCKELKFPKIGNWNLLVICTFFTLCSNSLQSLGKFCTAVLEELCLPKSKTDGSKIYLQQQVSRSVKIMINRNVNIPSVQCCPSTVKTTFLKIEKCWYLLQFDPLEQSQNSCLNFPHCYSVRLLSPPSGIICWEIWRKVEVY